MNIYTDISGVKLEKPVATIGIFDGVHLAHKAIISRLMEVAENIHGESLIVTLWPHPRIVLQTGGAPLKLLTTLEEKIEILELTGVENLLILDFNKAMSEMGFEDFVGDILIKQLDIQHLVVGYNHHFGKNREGNFENLQQLSSTYGFGLEQLEPVIVNSEKISSSLIRSLIFSGNVKEANLCLGHFFSITGQVVEGKKVGREIGFPTANIQIANNYKLFPDNGVYAVLVMIDNERERMAMMNIGYRPTLENPTNIKTLEVHVIDYEGNLYNKTLKVYMIEKIREEKKFKNLDELKIQLEKDRILSIQILSKLKMS